MCLSATRSSTSGVQRRPVFEGVTPALSGSALLRPAVSRYRLPGFDDTQSRTCRRILLRSARTCMMIDRHHKYRRLPKRNLDRVHVDRNTSGKPNHDIGEIAYTYMHHVRMISASCVYAYLHACMHPLCTDVYIRHASTPNDVRSTSIHHAFGIPFQYQ